MKAIVVMFDSLNRRMLPPYGCDWVHAPNFQRLAHKTITFDNCYIGSMPCMPARREFHTGRYNFLHRSWGPLEPFDDSVPEILRENGVYIHLVTDHTHYFEDGGATYHTRYNGWEFNRGQEGDAWKGFVTPPFDIPPITRRMEKNQSDRMWTQEFINRQYMPTPEDYPQSHTFSQGIEFLRNNHTADRWCLHIEPFDPHEPFFTHQQYKDPYPDEYDGPIADWISYGRFTEDPTTIYHFRYEYAALVSFCDAQLGRLLDTMDELDLWRDTLLIVCTDHGLLLGEHDWWAKISRPGITKIPTYPFSFGIRSDFRMSDNLLQEYTRQYIEAQRVRDITFAWQGGEPTLMGLDFFRQAVAYQQQHRRPGMRITNALQTNGINLDDEWSAFFKANNFLIGISLDGPRELHDAYRVDKGGQPTFDRVMAGLRLLQKRGVEFNVLTTVHAANAARRLLSTPDATTPAGVG